MTIASHSKTVQPILVSIIATLTALLAALPFPIRAQEEWTRWEESSSRAAGVRQTLAIGGEDYGFCWIPAGEFEMGFSEFDEQEIVKLAQQYDFNPHPENHRRRHVTLTRGFWFLETPVTQALYEAVMKSNPSHFQGADLPVEQVTYDEALAFCEELTKLLPKGLKAALPTEAQWEYACRAGTTTAFWFGDSANGFEANCDGNRPFGTTQKGIFRQQTSPVKSYPANPWGLYDVHGNVNEWTLDGFGPYPFGDAVDPLVCDRPEYNAYRGGGWDSPAYYCFSAARGFGRVDLRSSSNGFRVLVIAAPTMDEAEALYQKGRRLRQGSEGEKLDREEAVRLLEEANEKGSLKARALLAMYYFDRARLDKVDDYKLAYKLALEPAQNGVAAGNLVLGEIFQKGNVVEANSQWAHEYFKKARIQFAKDAETDDSFANYFSGEMYERGFGGEIDVEKGKAFYLKAIELRNSVALTRIGTALSEPQSKSAFVDESVKLDAQQEKELKRQGMDYLIEADKLQNDGATVILALLYTKKLGFVNDMQISDEERLKKGADLLKRAINLNPENSKAAYELAKRYETGHGVEKDLETAIEWYQVSAELGSPDGLYEMGLHYMTGVGVEENVPKGFEGFMKAADRGSGNAMYCIGLCYENEVAVKKDEAQAIFWYRKAAELGVTDAIERLNVLENR